MIKATPIATGKSTIWLDHEGILHLVLEEGAEIDLEECERCFKIYRELGCEENKVPQLIDGRSAFNITSAARDYAAEQGKKVFIASAIISDSLPTRMLVNFFNAFYPKKGVPFKMFSGENEAIAWLRTIRDKGLK
ncbi:MAG TPA: hypothetical protein VI731_02615 [Bacteroidia bacterium]|nr:hypothetical protein [Bacteroidia bacterium]